MGRRKRSRFQTARHCTPQPKQSHLRRIKTDAYVGSNPWRSALPKNLRSSKEPDHPNELSRSRFSCGAGQKHCCPSIRKFESDPDNAFFEDGVQDETLTDLARIADLKVISRTSVISIRPERNETCVRLEMNLASRMWWKEAFSAPAIVYE